MFNTNKNFMKHTITLSILLLIVINVLAQSPLAFNYQAILRDADGIVISSQNVSLEIAIRKGSASGTIVFSETHNTSTNEFGLVNLQIGSIQSLAGVNFSEDSYFLEMSVNGTVMGSSQLLSVPFAIHANTSTDAFSGDYNDLTNLPNLDDFIGISNPQAGDILFFNQNQWQALSAGAEGQVITSINGMPQWAYITDPTYSLNLEVSPAGAGTVTGSGQYEAGQQFSISAQANTGWGFLNWTNANGVVSEAPNFLYTMPASDVTLTANFEMIDYTLTLVANPTEGGSVSGGGVYNLGDAVQLGAVANTGWEFVNWTDNDGIVSAAANFTYTMPATDVTLTANFEMIDYTLTLVANPTEGGSVSGGGFYNLGDAVQLGALANTGWEFVNWTDNDGIVSAAANFTYTMPAADVTLTANFEMIDYTLTLVANPTEGGSVSGGGDYNLGDAVQLGAVANTGWEFVNWTDNNGIVSAAANFTYTMPATDVTLTANFEMIDYTLTLVSSPTEGGSLSGSGVYNLGDAVQLGALANTGWVFVNWTDNAGVVSEAPDFTYTMPAADITLTANFVEEQVGFTCGGQITDIDGNIYNTVLIGDQCWIKGNLKTTKYQSGTPIEYPGGNSDAWMNNTTGAYAWYNNDISWKDSYGAVYNWHAVNNADGLCPTGWHVPSDTELTQLVNYVVAQGYPNVWNIPNGAGNALKSCRQVNSPQGGDCNTTEHPRWDSHLTHNGFDAFGFSGLPGGSRSNTGVFLAPGSSFGLWSSTEHSATHAHTRTLSLMSNLVSRIQSSKSGGISVRCIKTPPMYNLNLDVNPTGAGTITGAGLYQAGQQVNITAAANLGWAFDNWTDDDGIVSEAPNFTYTMPASEVTLTANFVTTTTHNLNLDVNPAGAGTVTGAGLYNSGQHVNISALANTGWEFVNWTDDDVIVSELAVFTYTIPAADVTLTANFVEEQVNFTCGTSTVTDVDGYVYNTVLIGDQCWMDKNLSTTRFRDGSTIAQAWVYDPTLVEGINSAGEMVAAYGRLYSWHAANDAKGICPAGWTVPVQSEFQQLVDYVIATYEEVTAANSAYAFKSCRQVDSPLGGDCNTTAHPRWDQTTPPTPPGLDLVGFSALPAGRIMSGAFSAIGTQLYFWSSTEHNAANGVFARIMNGADGVTITNVDKNRGFSLRCIRPAPPTYNLNLEVSPADAGTVTGAGHYQAGEEINITAAANTGWEFVNWTDNNGIVSEAPNFLYTMPAADVTLTANFVEEQVGFTCGGQITDIDGNIYNTVLIGDQCWIKGNLKTTKYQSGTPIEYPGGNSDAWMNNTTGAYAWYNNDISWKDSYGALYNWHAVNNADGLCPTGWHVPSDTELTQLVNYVVAQGYPNVWNNPNGAGNALKSCRQVNSPQGGDCNTTEHPRWDSNITHNGFDVFGFSGLPGGSRSGVFLAPGSSFGLWSSTEHSATHAHTRTLSLMSNLVSRIQSSKSNGISVRCIKTPSTR
jgi:uncharacterized protein (TIGR02145 family)/uncharacterized repeat protein (TIGR02543 family)